MEQYIPYSLICDSKNTINNIIVFLIHFLKYSSGIQIAEKLQFSFSEKKTQNFPSECACMQKHLKEHPDGKLHFFLRKGKLHFFLRNGKLHFCLHFDWGLEFFYNRLYTFFFKYFWSLISLKIGRYPGKSRDFTYFF